MSCDTKLKRNGGLLGGVWPAGVSAASAGTFKVGGRRPWILQPGAWCEASETELASGLGVSLWL